MRPDPSADTLLRFACDRCGKRYATAEPPMLGSVYGLTCKACGHHIVLLGEKAEPPPPTPRWLDAAPSRNLRRGVVGRDRSTSAERLSLPGATSPPPRALPPARLPTEIEDGTAAAAPKPLAPAPRVVDPGAVPESQTREPEWEKAPDVPVTARIASPVPVEPAPSAIGPGALPEGQTGEPEQARPPDVPAAATSLTPEPVKPPAAARATPLSPEQVDALLERYLRDPSRPGTTPMPMTAPPRVAAPQATVWRLAVPGAGAISRLLGRMPLPILAAIAVLTFLAAIAVPALLAGGAYGYLRHFAGERSASDVAQPGTAAPPAPSPTTAVAAVSRPASTAIATRTPRLEPPKSAAPVATRAAARMVPVARETANRKPGVGATESRRIGERDSPKGETAVAATAAAAPSAPSPPIHRSAPPEEVQRPTLSALDVRTVVASHRHDLDTCVADWRDWLPEADVSGLKIDLLITVNPTGAVTRAELGNLDVDRSVLGDCLKAVGKEMVFPPFGGEALTVRVPLVLGQAAQ